MVGAFPTEFLKFRKLDENAIQMLTTGECYYSTPSGFNDPLDCTYSLENFPPEISGDISEIFAKEKSKIAFDFLEVIRKGRRRIDSGVVSLSARYANSSVADPMIFPDIWGHYGDEHKGICIGFSPIRDYTTLDIRNSLKPQREGKWLKFDVPDISGSSNLLSHLTSASHNRDNLLSGTSDYFIQVNYSDEFKLEKPDWDIVRKNYESLDKSGIKNSDQLFESTLKGAISVRKVISNKHANWSSENEFRLFGASNKSQSIGAAINSVTFGLEMSDESKKFVISLIARFYGLGSVAVYKMKLVDGMLRQVPLEMNDALPSSSSSTASFSDE